MTTVLVTGGAGQLGRELQRMQWPRGFDVLTLMRDQLNVADETSVNETIARIRPALIVNAAAYTAVDRAEDESDKAFATNATGTAHLARAADRNGARLVHLSTDYVFDGAKADWYVESDPIAPLGVYGRSKAQGEQAALEFPGTTVLRTAWVYGAFGGNFVKTMLRLARERPVIGVVADQKGCPTAAKDIATAIGKLAPAALDGAVRSRLFHLTSPVPATWHEFAAAVFKASGHGFKGEFRALRTAEYPTRAVRPANSRLDSSLIEAQLGIRLPDWHDSLTEVVREIESGS